MQDSPFTLVFTYPLAVAENELYLYVEILTSCFSLYEHNSKLGLPQYRLAYPQGTRALHFCYSPSHLS